MPLQGRDQPASLEVFSLLLTEASPPCQPRPSSGPRPWTAPFLRVRLPLGTGSNQLREGGFPGLDLEFEASTLLSVSLLAGVCMKQAAPWEQGPVPPGKNGARPPSCPTGACPSRTQETARLESLWVEDGTDYRLWEREGEDPEKLARPLVPAP